MRCILQPLIFKYSISFYRIGHPLRVVGCWCVLFIYLEIDSLFKKQHQQKKRQLQNFSDKSCKYSWKWLNDGSCRFYQYLGNEVYLIYIHFFLILVGMAAHSRSSQPSPCNWVVEALALRKSVFLTSSAIFQWRNPG